MSISIRIPAPPAEMPRFIRDHLSQAYRVIEQSFSLAVRRGQDYEVGAAKIYLTAPDGTRYYITVDNSGNIGTDAGTPGGGTVTSVAATAPAAGFTITGSPITSSGTFVFALADDLAALEALSSTGFAARTASNTWAQRTITAGTGALVDNGSGVSGNPTLHAALKGYIDGLRPSYNSATSISVSTGTAYIESLGRVFEANSTITKSSLSLSANTWYHLYLYSNSGTADIEVSSTAPVVYHGTARSKTGDNSRRYVGSVRTDGSGNVIQFKVDAAGDFRYLTSNSAQRILSAGTASSRTTVSGSDYIPVTATHSILQTANTDTAVFWSLSQPEASASSIIGIAPNSPGSVITFPCSDSQQFDYFFSPGRTGAAYIDILGFCIAR